MSKNADIGSKRLIKLKPTAWARWLTGDPDVEAVELLSEEFQWISRANDALLKATSAQHGDFLIVNEIQIRPDARMARRMRAYTALAEEHYNLNTYPVVVNILPGKVVSNNYHKEFMGLTAHQDFRVINLWEEDVSLVFEQNLSPLLPFVPILKGGHKPEVLKRAVSLLRRDDKLVEMEPLLAFFASFVLNANIVRQIMRWDMTILKESPWYNEILQEGLKTGLQQGIEQGIEQGQQQERLKMLLYILKHRLEPASDALKRRLEQLDRKQLLKVADMSLEASTLAEVEQFVTTLEHNEQGG